MIQVWEGDGKSPPEVERRELILDLRRRYAGFLAGGPEQGYPKIAIVKYYRRIVDAGLREAKEFCEQYVYHGHSGVRTDEP